MAKVGVCLSGCGFLDGAEIHESVCTLVALDRAGAQTVCCAPNVDQADTVNHLTGQPVPERRNVLVESARIARGQIKDLSRVAAVDLDALVFPGGFGAAKNLCSFASEGPQCSVHPEVERLIGEMLRARKPIGALCIAPAMLARVLERLGVKASVTIGTDAATADAIGRMGITHEECPPTGCVVDCASRIVTTPAYMSASGPAEVFAGAERLVSELLALISA